MDLANLLQSPMGQQMISGISQQMGMNESQAQSAVATAAPVLLSALNKKANNEGTSGLMSMLDADGDGSIIDDVMGFISGSNDGNGEAIVSNLLGGNQQTVENKLGQSAGVSGSQMHQILAMVAPVILSYLTKQKGQSGESGVMSMISGMLGGVQNNNPREMSMVERLLDQDGDGSALDDAMDLGSKLLGGLFKK